MIVLAGIIIYRESRQVKVTLAGWPIALLITGSLLVILSFIWDYSAYMLEHFNFLQLFSITHSDAMLEAAYDYVPRNFKWWLFFLAEGIILVGIFLANRSSKKTIQ
jgi:hypothetical protein